MQHCRRRPRSTIRGTSTLPGRDCWFHATRRYIDEQTVWALMRFADEPAERVPSRQITRLQRDDARGFSGIEKGEFDRGLDGLSDGANDLEPDD